MNRRGFLKRLFGGAAVVATAPVLDKVWVDEAKEVAVVKDMSGNGYDFKQTSDDRLMVAPDGIITGSSTVPCDYKFFKKLANVNGREYMLPQAIRMAESGDVEAAVLMLS